MGAGRGHEGFGLGRFFEGLEGWIALRDAAPCGMPSTRFPAKHIESVSSFAAGRERGADAYRQW